MSIPSTLKYISTSLLLLFGTTGLFAQQTADTDTTADAPVLKIKERTRHQLVVAYDITQPVINAIESYRKGNEISADYYLKHELYLVAEGGWGSSKVDYDNLKYTTTNSFARIGINKCMLQRMKPEDWDMAFLGVRLGMASVQRSSATYIIADSLWGSTSGNVPGKSFAAAWAEVTGGMRVEFAKGLFAGWTARGKFRLNGGSFKDLSPLYIAGYGRGDKGAVFDFNVYVGYTIRWKRKDPDMDPDKAPVSK